MKASHQSSAIEEIIIMAAKMHHQQSRITTSWKKVYLHDNKFIVRIVCLQVFQVPFVKGL